MSMMYIKLFTFPIMTATQSPCLRAVYQDGKHNNTTQICLTLIWISCLFHSPLSKHSKALWYPVNKHCGTQKLNLEAVSNILEQKL